MTYAALHTHTYYSLLDAASSPEAMVAQARALGLSALAITDHDTLAGAVRFLIAARKAELHGVIGCEVTLDDGCHLTVLAETQDGYTNLCRLLTHAHLRQPADGATEWPDKADRDTPFVTWDDLHCFRNGVIALSGCKRGPVASALMNGRAENAKKAAIQLADIFGRRNTFIELQHHAELGDDERVHGLVALAKRLKLECIATDNAHYATREEHLLRCALVAVKHIETIKQARLHGLLTLNSNHHLASPEQMLRRFAELPEAVHRSAEIAARCDVSLDFAGQCMPDFEIPTNIPGVTTDFEYVWHLCQHALPVRYPHPTPKVIKQLAHELDVITKNRLAPFFLVMWDIVRFARSQGIRCQGRGSAAGSITAYLLGITAIDPLEHDLLFERFLSDDAHTMPDIDLDLPSNEAREQVIQYVLNKYGHAHAAFVCTLVTFRARSALRDFGKALDFPLATLDRLSKLIDAHEPAEAAEQLLARLGDDATPPMRQLAGLMQQVEDIPRHLGTHPGGILISKPPLDEVTVIRRAAMPNRYVVELDKDSAEDCGLTLKADLLGLRMLGAIGEAERLLQAQGVELDLERLPLDDASIYEMLRRGDGLGVFQFESRGQQNLLPRLAPTCFDDLTKATAMWRPGPMESGVVQPIIRRRRGEEPITYLHPCLEPVLRESYGTILFQEQAVRISVVAAGFTPSEADKLRRAMSRTRSKEAMAEIEARFLDGTSKNGIELETAQAIFKQLAGFAAFGFCKSHAASFARIGYTTAWLKRYHPLAFYCGLLNHHPGYYPIEVIVGDARRHNIKLLPADINLSRWEYVLEGKHIRTGLCALNGLGERGWQRIEVARRDGPFSSLSDLCQRTQLPKDTVFDLIRAGTCDVFGKRRESLWQELGRIAYDEDELLLALVLDIPDADVDLAELEDREAMGWEYELTGFSTRGQFMQHYRPALRRAGVLTTEDAKRKRPGVRVRVAGMKILVQRPARAHGVSYVTLEDHAGLIDLTLRPDVYKRYRDVVRNEHLIMAEGVLQNDNGAVSVLVTQVQKIGVDSRLQQILP